MADQSYRRVEKIPGQYCAICDQHADRTFLVEYGWYGREVWDGSGIKSTTNRYRRIDDSSVSLCDSCLEQERRDRRRAYALYASILLIAGLIGALLLDVPSMFGIPAKYNPIVVWQGDSTDFSILGFLVMGVVIGATGFSVGFFFEFLKTFLATWTRERGLRLAWLRSRKQIEEQLSHIDAFEVFYPNGLGPPLDFASATRDKYEKVGTHDNRYRKYHVTRHNDEVTAQSYLYWIGPRGKEVDNWEEEPVRY